MSFEIQAFTRKELKALPVRPWASEDGFWDSLLIFPEGRKHDSGWGLMTIVGCRKQVPIEILVPGCDDIAYESKGAQRHYNSMRMDCVHGSKCMHVWSNFYKFKVGAALSSVTIELITK